MNINEKLDFIILTLKDFSLKFEEIDKRFDAIDKRFEEIDKKFEAIDKRFEEIDKKFKAIDKRFEEIDKKFEAIDKRFEKIDERLNQIDRKITIIDVNNKEEHKKIFEALHSLNNSFLKFESESNDKFGILFDAYKDLKDHQTIYNTELNRLNDIVEKNSYRISTLEKAIN